MLRPVLFIAVLISLDGCAHSEASRPPPTVAEDHPSSTQDESVSSVEDDAAPLREPNPCADRCVALAGACRRDARDALVMSRASDGGESSVDEVERWEISQLISAYRSKNELREDEARFLAAVDACDGNERQCSGLCVYPSPPKSPKRPEQRDHIYLL